jgi:hypothetical protein
MQSWKTHADWRLIPEFRRDAIIAYVDRGERGDEFIEALFSNQFTLVCVSADLCSKQRLMDYAKFLMEYAPAVCQGSPQAYADWISIGGMEGFVAATAKAID